LLGAGAIGYFAYRAGFSNNNNNNLSGNATAAAGANTTSQQAHTETSSSEAAGYDQFGVKKIYPDASPAKYSPTTGGGNLSVHIRRPPQPPLSRRQWEGDSR
jgi:hypothetical protein